MELIQITDRGNFFVGGFTRKLTGLQPYEVRYLPDGAKTTMDPNGTFQAGQMYVQYTKTLCDKYPPVVFIHGGGMTGAAWETTPDGRAGWDTIFLRNGYSTYIVDSVERGRSGWARYPEINESEPIFRSYESVWTAFRFGHIYPTPFPELRFPYESYPELMKEIVPRWSTSNNWKQNAFDELFSRFTTPCIVIAHSSGALFALRSAVKMSSKVKALILVEPASAPGSENDSTCLLAQIPHLVLWGDYFHEEKGGPVPQTLYHSYHTLWPRYIQKLEQCHGDFTWMEFPKMGIRGNSHLLMMDNNSEEIASIILGWIKEKLPYHR